MWLFPDICPVHERPGVWKAICANNMGPDLLRHMVEDPITCNYRSGTRNQRGVRERAIQYAWFEVSQLYALQGLTLVTLVTISKTFVSRASN
jgi:hypothetical protein